MARVDNLENFLTDVADAIREKKGTQDQIPAGKFDTEIKSITSGLDTSDATATADDIISPKTAYLADGTKHIGTIIPTYETTKATKYLKTNLGVNITSIQSIKTVTLGLYDFIVYRDNDNNFHFIAVKGEEVEASKTFACSELFTDTTANDTIFLSFDENNKSTSECVLYLGKMNSKIAQVRRIKYNTTDTKSFTTIDSIVEVTPKVKYGWEGNTFTPGNTPVVIMNGNLFVLIFTFYYGSGDWRTAVVVYEISWGHLTINNLITSIQGRYVYDYAIFTGDGLQVSTSSILYVINKNTNKITQINLR